MNKTNLTNEDKIFNDLEHSYFVDAGAGSGKTFSVAKRMVQVAVQKPLEDSKMICAITYTNAAADVFYERYQKFLLEEISLTTDIKLKEKLQSCYENIDYCFMGTIDAFCKKILEEHPLEAGLPANLKIASYDDIKIVLNNLYDEFSSMPEYDNEIYDLINYDIVFYDPREAFSKITLDLLKRRAYKLDYEVLPDTFEEYIEDIKNDVIKTIEDIERYHLICDESKDDYDNINTSILSGSDDWDKDFASLYRVFSALSNKNKIKLEKDRNYDSCYFNKDCLDFSEVKKKFIGYSFFKLVNFCSKKLEYVSEVLKSEGLLSFTDNLYYLSETLRNDAETGGTLIRKIQKKYKYFFLDEFQDTDPLQVQIFFYLSSIDPKPIWHENIPRPGSLFIVGDPKQSIYRFKGADIKSYSFVEDLFKNETVGEVLSMPKNRRSTNTLKVYFNKLFLKPKNLNNPYNISNFYNKIPVEIEKLDHEGFTGAFSYDLSDNQFADIAELVLRIVNNPNIVADIENKQLKQIEHRMIDFNDIMIITKTKDKIIGLSKVFKDYNIKHFCVGGNGFADSSLLILFRDIISFLVNDDKYSLTCILKSPLIDLSYEEIRKVLNGELTTNNELNLFLNHLKSFSKNSLNKERITTYIFNDLLKHKYILSIADSSSLGTLYYTYELLLSAENEGSVTSLNQGLNYIDKLLSGEESAERELLLNSNSGVMIANLHKVKGLEKPVVITLGNKVSSKPQSFYATNQPFVYTPLSFGEGYSVLKTFTRDDLQEKAKKEAEEEADRVRYVAATRACNIFIVTYKMNKSSLQKNTFSDLLCESVESIKPHLKDLEIDEKKIVKRKELQEIKFNNKKSLNILKPSYVGHVAHGSVEANENDGLKATDIGTMIHKLMQVLVLSKKQCNIDDMCEQISVDNIGTLGYKFQLINIANEMLNGGYEQTNGVCKDILNEILSSEEYFTEVPFSYREKEKIYYGIIDAVYLKDGVYHIIDYKTDASKDNLDEKHKDQLEIYTKALKSLGYDKVDAHIYRIPKEG